jgi:hypothetical protein
LQNLKASKLKLKLFQSLSGGLNIGVLPNSESLLITQSSASFRQWSTLNFT